MKRLCLLLLSHLCLIMNTWASSSVYNILDFGAVADGPQKSTQAIQKAIQACHSQGGGTVYVPAGNFTVGTLQLLSRVTLHLEAGAVLKGSADLSDYMLGGKRRGIIFAVNAEQVALTGLGSIDGNGTFFHDPTTPQIPLDYDAASTRQGEAYLADPEKIVDGPIDYAARPGFLVTFVLCKQVKIIDVTFSDAPNWAFYIGNCDNVQIRGISVFNNLLIPNSDGIHCTSSRNINISDCDIRAGDDAIVVTGFGPLDMVGVGPQSQTAENVTVSNCNLQSRSSGIRVGYAEDNIRNCVFQNINIYDSNRGIGVFVRDRGSIENVLFSNITIQTRLHTGHWWGHGEPIHVSVIPRNEHAVIGKISNVRFRDIIAHSESGIVLYGISESIMKDLSLENIRLHIAESSLNKDYGGNFDLRPVLRTQDAIFRHDIPGIYAQYVDGLRVEDFQLSWDPQMSEFFSAVFEGTHVTDVMLDGLKGKPAPTPSGVAFLDLSHSEAVTVRNCQVEAGTPVFIKHRNLRNLGLLVNNEDERAKTRFSPAASPFGSKAGER